MKAIARVFAYEFRRQGRRRAYLFISIGIPLLALLLFYGFRAYQQMRPNSDLGALFTRNTSSDTFRPVGVVDNSRLLEGSVPLFSNLIVYKTEKDAEAAIRANKVGSYYVIAPDYLQTGHIDLYFNRFSLNNINTPALTNWIMDSLIKKSGKSVDPNVVKRLQESSPVVLPHNVSEAGGVKDTTNAGTSFFLAYVFSMALMFSAFMTSGYLMQSIVEEKETRMIEILLSSVRPTQLLAGKILALGLLGLLQMVCWGATLAYLLGQLPSVSPETFGVQAPSINQLAIVVVYFILGFLLLSSFYASIGAISTNMREGPQLAAFISLPMVIPLYALQLITSAPNGSLAVTLSLIPFTAPLTMVSRATLTDIPLWQVIISVGLLILTILFSMWLAGRMFRVNTLLAGQFPRLRDLPRLLREGM